MSINGYVSVEDAAGILGCTAARIRQLLGEGIISGEKVGERVWLVDEKTVHKYRIETKGNNRGRPRISGR